MNNKEAGDKNKRVKPGIEEPDFIGSSGPLDYDTIVELECGDRAYADYPLREKEYCFVCRKYSKVVGEV
jgi:hypothetical protein